MPQPEQSGGQPPQTHQQKLNALHAAREKDIALRGTAMFGGRDEKSRVVPMAYDFNRRGALGEEVLTPIGEEEKERLDALPQHRSGRRGPAVWGALVGAVASAAGFGAVAATTHQAEPPAGRNNPVIVPDTRPTRGPGVVIIPTPTESPVPTPTAIPTTPSQPEGEQLQPKPEPPKQPTEVSTPMYEKSEVAPEGMWLSSQGQINDELGEIDQAIGFTNFVTRFNLYLAPSGKRLSTAALRALYEHRDDTFQGAFDAVNGRSDMDPNVDKDNAAVFQGIEAQWTEQTATTEAATSTNSVAKAVNSVDQAKRTAAVERARAVSKSVGNFFTSQRRIRDRQAYA